MRDGLAPADADVVRTMALSRGALFAAPIEGLPASTDRADPDLPDTHSRKITAGIDYGLGRETKLTVEYATVQGLAPRSPTSACAL